MEAWNHISTVARTEAKILSRSWTFRFFTVFSSALLVTTNIMFFKSVYTSWQYRCIASAPAYFNVLIIALIQSIIVPFGVFDSVRNERKLDTLESLHAQSFTNAAHVFGKAVGIMLPFLYFNAFVLVFTLVFNIAFMNDVPVVWQSYVAYPLMLGLPALFCVTSVSFFLMSAFKHRALSLLLVIGYSLFAVGYGAGHVQRLIDFTGFHLPMLYSDFVGIGNIGEIALHRLAYFLLGFGLLACSAAMFERLIQSTASNRTTRYAAIICIALFPLIVFVQFNEFEDGVHLRSRMNELSSEYVSYPHANMTECVLDIDHTGSSLTVEAVIALSNSSSSPIDTVILTLNPGFRVVSVVSGGTALDFERDAHIVKITPPSPIETGEKMTMTINYTGTFDSDACYIDIEEDYRAVLNRLFVFGVDKRYGFVTHDYVLLTPECTWYPVSGIPYGWVFPDAHRKDFTRFTVTVNTSGELTVISQANVQSLGNGIFHFQTDEKLSGLTLAIGDYDKMSVVVDDVECAVFVLRGHDYFSQYLKNGQEIVKEVIGNEMQNVEYTYGMKYPFGRYMLVEAPVQFMAYQRPWRSHTELVQPQMSILPEKGAFIQASNFGARYAWRKYRNTGQISTISSRDEEAIARDIIDQFIRNQILDDTYSLQEYEDRHRILQAYINHSMFPVFSELISDYIAGSTISAQFFPFLTLIDSGEYPVFPYLMELYRKNGNSLHNRTTRTEPIIPEEIVCMEMDGRSFDDILANGGQIDRMETLLRLKAIQLFVTLSADIGIDRFNELLDGFIAENVLRTVNLSQFVAYLEMHTGINYSTTLMSWYQERSLPEFVTEDPQITQVTASDRILYQTTFRVHNVSGVAGALWCELEESASENLYHDRIVTLEPHQSKEIGFVTDMQPSRIVLNMLASKNIPMRYSLYLGGTAREDHEAEPFEGIRTIAYSPPTKEPDAIVVDNLDTGFNIIHEPTEKYPMLRAISQFEIGMYPEGFVKLLPGLTVPFWAKSVFIKGYGKMNSACYTSPGNGDGRVSWTAHIEEAGTYNLEYYFHDTRSAGILSGGQNDPISHLPLIGEYNFTIMYGNTTVEMTITPSTSGGWRFLDTFDLEPGDVTVELSNESTGRFIYADAVKWARSD